MPIWLYAALVLWATVMGLLFGLSVWGAIMIALGPRWGLLYLVATAILIVPAFCYAMTRE